MLQKTQNDNLIITFQVLPLLFAKNMEFGGHFELNLIMEIIDGHGKVPLLHFEHKTSVECNSEENAESLRVFRLLFWFVGRVNQEAILEDELPWLQILLLWLICMEHITYLVEGINYHFGVLLQNLREVHLR